MTNFIRNIATHTTQLKLFLRFSISFLTKFFFFSRIPFSLPTRIFEYTSMRVMNRRLHGASNISLEDRREWLRSRDAETHTRHKFYHRQTVPLAPLLPSFSWQRFLSPSFSWGLFGRPLLNLRPINQTIPYKFVTREIARIPGVRGCVFSLSPTRTPGRKTSLCSRVPNPFFVFSARLPPFPRAFLALA